MDQNLFIKKKQTKKRLRSSDTNDKKITKKRKTLNNIPPELQYIVSDSKVLNLKDNNKLSWRDSNDNELSPLFDDDSKKIDENKKLPPSMKFERNLIVPPRESHNDLLLDPLQNKLGITSKFINNNNTNNNNHIIQIIPHGFIDILPAKATLDIALHSCLKDNEIIKENIKLNNQKNKLKKTNNNKYNGTIHTIQIVNCDKINFNYSSNKRLSKNQKEDTFTDFEKFTKECREKFFKSEELEFPLIINSDLEKSEIFNKLEKNYKSKYNSRIDHNSEIASKELKTDLPIIERAYIKEYRFPPNKELGHRECVNKEHCLMNTFKSYYSNKSDQYIGREFLLKEDHNKFKNLKILPNIVGPCIDCLLSEWTNKVFTEVLKFNLIPEHPINTFRVECKENEYDSSACLPQIFRSNVWTGISGWCPSYYKHLRTYSPEIIYNENGDEIQITYLAEMNTDFRLSLVK
jgi:hypothetical protein